MTDQFFSSTYYSEDGVRKAIAYTDELGWRVALLEHDVVVQDRKVYEHSEDYAGDLAENWVMYIGEFKV